MGMARAAHAHAIGVTWGYHPEADLLVAGAQGIAHVPAEVFTIAQSLGQQAA